MEAMKNLLKENKVEKSFIEAMKNLLKEIKVKKVLHVVYEGLFE
jgi:hypothetical protein